MATSPGSDNNCNIYMPPLGCSVASSHDFSDYQWFTDFGSYRDGMATHQSILSVLSASYNGIGELSFYEKMAKDIDANLAEIDMENFRTEDIHSLLTAIPSQLKSDPERKTRNNNRIFSAVTGATAAGLIAADMMDNSICKSELLFSPVKESHISVDSLDMEGYPDEEDIILTCQANKDNYTIAFEQSVLYSDESYYDGPENYGKYKRMNLLNNIQNRSPFIKQQQDSLSRSEVGYTTWSKLKRNGPVQRTPIVMNPLISHISRHARTCFVRKSLSMPNLQSNQTNANQPPHHPPIGQHPLNVSQAPAASHNSAESFDRPTTMRTLLPMYTLPTDSENESSTNGNEGSLGDGRHDDGQCDRKQHLANERQQQQQQQQQQQHQQPQQLQQQPQSQQQPSFNLVKLFIKQKSSSTDTCMDVSSGCWPSDSTNSGASGDHQSHHLGVGAGANGIAPPLRCRKKSMQDSGKCSSTMGGAAGVRHGCDDEEFQLDSLDAQINNNNNNGSHGDDEEEEEELEGGGPPASPGKARGGVGMAGQMKLNDFNRQVHCSPRRQYKGYNMNIGGGRGNQGMKNPAVHGLLHNHNGSSSTGTASPLNSSSSINNNNHNVNNNNSFKDTNSDTSRTSENLTQIFNHSGNNNTTANAASGGNGGGACSKTRIPIDMITKSMQTSLIGTPSGMGAGAGVRDKVRVIPPSFLDRLNELGDKQKAPVFVVYPNYVLPDLGFLKAQNEVVISPLSFKETMKGTVRPLKKARPVSMNDIETIRQREYKHVMDWKSLLTLLPTDYRKLLRHIPEVSELSVSTEKQPMFCMTPPLRRGVPRGVNCDCMNLLHQNTQTCTNSSSSGGSSSAAPSSGYRGSSTILTTDSEMDGILGPSNSSNTFSNNLYVYQYDSPAEVLASCERPPSGRAGAGGVPKSILRRPAGSTRGASSNTNSNPANMKAKRSSMFEEQQLPHYPQGTREKRRSLQEHHSYNFYEDAEEQEVQEELMQPADHKLHNSPNMTPHPRLANTPKLPSADHYHKLNKLVEMSERELAAATGGHLADDDSEARARAEQFLSHVPKSELKHYAEIAHILESTETVESSEPPYDRTRLRNEVSRALSQRRNVTFTQQQQQIQQQQQQQQQHQQSSPSIPGGTNTTPVRQPASATGLLRPTEIKFSTPPNSPNMSVTVMKQQQGPTPTGALADKKPPLAQRTPSLAGSPSSVGTTEREKQDKIQTNRFKRLQIQWELLSQEASTRAACESQRKEIRSGGNTPTGGNSASKSRIPRPVSYPTTRTNSDPVVSKTLKSPSRIVPPRKYAAAPSPATTPPTPAPRTPNKTFSNTTPKKVSSVPSRIPLGSRIKRIPAT